LKGSHPVFPLLLLIPAGLIVWSLAKKHAEKQLAERHGVSGEIEGAVERALMRRMGMPGHAYAPPPQLSGPPAPPPTSSAAAFIEHLREASAAAAALNIVRPAAINADMASLMRAPPEAVHALEVLAQPIDMLTVQRDLNLLGATPPLPETGSVDKRTLEAVKAFQTRFRQVPTGSVDQATAIALRYAVGVVNFQNQMQVAS
jgi:hypothetical protein